MAHTLINAIKSYHCDMEPVVIKDFKGLKLDDPFQQMKMQTNALFFEWFMCNKVLECFNSGTRTETIQAVLIYTLGSEMPRTSSDHIFCFVGEPIPAHLMFDAESSGEEWSPARSHPYATRSRI